MLISIVQQTNSVIYIVNTYVCVYIYIYTHTHIFFFIFFSIVVYYRILNIVFCALQQDLVYLFYI